VKTSLFLSIIYVNYNFSKNIYELISPKFFFNIQSIPRPDLKIWENPQISISENSELGFQFWSSQMPFPYNFSDI
jgi:hypothetical protein